MADLFDSDLEWHEFLCFNVHMRFFFQVLTGDIEGKPCSLACIVCMYVWVIAFQIYNIFRQQHIMSAYIITPAVSTVNKRRVGYFDNEAKR